jgi:hypothetical protein
MFWYVLIASVDVRNQAVCNKLNIIHQGFGFHSVA